MLEEERQVDVEEVEGFEREKWDGGCRKGIRYK
jgi:hypothetical protein